MGSSWENVSVDDSKMRTYVSVPEESSKVPGIVVVQGQTGVNDFLKFSDMVATNGFVAAAPDLYHRDPADCKDDAPTRLGLTELVTAWGFRAEGAVDGEDGLQKFISFRPAVPPR